MSHTEKLTPQTGIGNKNKFAAGGLIWNKLKETALKLIDDGIIKVYESEGIKRVDLCDLNSLEVSIY